MNLDIHYDSWAPSTLTGPGAVHRLDPPLVAPGYGCTRQRFSAEGIVGRERLRRRQIFRLRCYDFEPNRLVGVVVTHIGAGGFGFDFWAGTGL